MSLRPNSPAARDVATLIHPYTNLSKHKEAGPLIIKQGKGIYVYDDDGKEYIEALAGLWSTSLGFGQEDLIEAAVKQMRELPTYHNFFGRSMTPDIDLAEKLLSIAPAPMSKVFFANSGSEANDTLVKLVWFMNNARGRPEKKKIIARRMGYHGVTVATASLTGIPSNHTAFDLPIPNILHTDTPHHYRYAEPGESEEQFSTRLVDNLEKLILDEGPETIAAFIAEPVMGAGGVIPPPQGYFEKVQALLLKYDVLFCDDEVICGFGRTGNPFGCDTYGFEPQTITVAKALSSAYMPISALMINEEMFDAVVNQSTDVGYFAHGFTYGGHPVPCAVALRVLELYEERDIYNHVRAVAPHFQKRLRAFADHPLVGEARGVGLIGALELVADKPAKRSFEPAQGVPAYCMYRAYEHGVMPRGMANALGFSPPLIITEPEIDEMFDRFAKALDDTEQWVHKENLREAA